VAAPPLAFIVSLIALLRGQNRPVAIAGMTISGLCAAVIFGIPIVGMLCR